MIIYEEKTRQRLNARGRGVGGRRRTKEGGRRACSVGIGIFPELQSVVTGRRIRQEDVVQIWQERRRAKTARNSPQAHIPLRAESQLFLEILRAASTSSGEKILPLCNLYRRSNCDCRPSSGRERVESTPLSSTFRPLPRRRLLSRDTLPRRLCNREGVPKRAVEPGGC